MDRLSHVTSNTRVYKLLQALENMLGVQQRNFRLYCNNTCTRLDAEDTLGQIGIEEGDTIDLLWEQLGC